MRKILSLTIVVILLLSILLPQSIVNNIVFADSKPENAVFVAASLRRVGYDWDGETLLDPPRDFPWQKAGSICWGRKDYYMPNALTALDEYKMPKPIVNLKDATTPIYYTQVYLNVESAGGLSTESNPYFAVIDSAGQLWFDPDGFFNDSRYDPKSDPLYPKAPFEIDKNPYYIPESCSINPRGLIDPSSTNNTKGPYYLDKFNPNYSTRQYFWDYKKDEKSSATNRMWRIGWADLVDYPFQGAILPDGTVSTGVVKNGDWDVGFPLFPFADNEYHTEIVEDGLYTPGKMSKNLEGTRPPEFIYRKVTAEEKKKGKIVVMMDPDCVWQGTVVEIYNSKGQRVISGSPNQLGIFETRYILDCPGIYKVVPKHKKLDFTPPFIEVNVPCYPNYAVASGFTCEERYARIVVSMSNYCVSSHGEKTKIHIYDEDENEVATGELNEMGIFDTGCTIICPDCPDLPEKYTIVPESSYLDFYPQRKEVSVNFCPEVTEVTFECMDKMARIQVHFPFQCREGTTVNIYNKITGDPVYGPAQPDFWGNVDTQCTLPFPGIYEVIPSSDDLVFDPLTITVEFGVEESKIGACPDRAEIEFSCTIPEEGSGSKSGGINKELFGNNKSKVKTSPCDCTKDKKNIKVSLNANVSPNTNFTTSKPIINDNSDDTNNLKKDEDCRCERDKSLEFTESFMQPIDSSIVVEVGDTRLTPVTIKKGEMVRNYPPNSIVQIGDWDVGLEIVNFSVSEKHTNNISDFPKYDAGEWIYNVLSFDINLVQVGSIRLTNVNTKRQKSGNRLALSLGCGIYQGDTLIMSEVFEGGCHTTTYNLSVLTDLYMGQSPSYTAARLYSPNGDVPDAVQRIQKSTVLDPGIDPERYYLLPGTTFSSLHFDYREYLGVEIFFDNGIDNNIGLEYTTDVLAKLDLSDNYRNGRTGEQFIGTKNGSGVLDFGRRIEVFKENYKYYNAGGETPPMYGCGEHIYYLLETNRNTIKAGDKRVTDVSLVVGNVRIDYNRNTIVADGDADVGLEVQNFTKEKLFIPNLSDKTPEYSAPFDYDPAINEIYYDNDDDSLVSTGDIRLTEVDIEGVKYFCGSTVEGGDFWFLDAPINMITVGNNGNIACLDMEVLPGSIGLKVEVDPPLQVEQTSTIKVSVDPPPKENEIVYVSIQDPQANEFNLFKNHWLKYRVEYTGYSYATKGNLMPWYGDDSSWTYELPFEFPFFGKFYKQVYVSSNGFLNFSSSYSLPLSLNSFDSRIVVYGDDLSILKPEDPACIAPTLPPGLVNYDNEGIYISEVADSVTIRWRAQTAYPVVLTGYPEDAGAYYAPDSNRYGLIDVSITLFSDGNFKLSYLKDVDEAPGDQIWKLYSKVNNIAFQSWVDKEPIIGFCDGNGFYLESAYNGLKNLACVDGAYDVNGNPYTDPFGGRYNKRISEYSDENWISEYVPFDQPSPESGGEFGGSYPEYSEIKPYEDFRVLTSDNPIAVFQYTPYRGTCKETGIPEWVEVRAYKDIGGRKIAPHDSNYTYISELNYCDPTVWNSKWTKTEYWKYPWGLFQKTKYFVYPPVLPNMPKELANAYDCFGLERLQIEPEKLKFSPSKDCVNPMDERQPLFWMSVYDSDNPNDINDPQGMAVSTFRRTSDAICRDSRNTIQLDYGVTDEWTPRENDPSPVNTKYLKIDPAYMSVFKVGDIVYIQSQPYVSGGVAYPPTAPEYRRIVRINKALNRIWFDLPLKGSYAAGSQVVPNPIIGNYNIKGGGINGLFTTIGAVGQRYIVQLRDDGSYDYWRWYEPLVLGQVAGALDPNDLLYTWQQPASFNRSEATTPYTPIRTPFPFPMGRPSLSLEDLDCSEGETLCSICGDTAEFPKLGEWSKGDRYGIFGNGNDIHPYFPNINGVPSQPYGEIYTWGVPVLIIPNKSPVPTDNLYDEGGKCVIAAWPQDPKTPMNIRLYLNTAVYDYNSTIKHPPYFIPDLGMGIDYCGETSIKVANANPVLNFNDFTIIDHALQNSKVNYTLGNGALAPLAPPSPQIAARYYPILLDQKKEFRSYPGGQSNTGRVSSTMSEATSKTTYGSAWNAYPAMWRDQFVKLGSEFMPLTDYGIAFYLKGSANPYDKFSFYGSGMQRINKIEIEGPFAVPKTFTEDMTRGRQNQPDLYNYRLNTNYSFNGYDNVPLDYDFSGKIEINPGNVSRYELTGGNLGWYSDPYLCATLPTSPLDFRRVTQPSSAYDALITPLNDVNPWLKFDNRWFYWGAFRFPNVPPPYWYPQTVFLIDELIPVGAGSIKIIVTMADGNKISYTDCCDETKYEGIQVNGININDAPKTLEIDEDHGLSLNLQEGYIPEQETEYCNNALLVVWQDRGITNPDTGAIMGAGDGHIANPPRSSNWHRGSSQFSPNSDINKDGKISFSQFETEIMGTYDLATNTWSSGVIDGRTFMREDGTYDVNLTDENGSQLTTIGYDFGGIPDETGEFDKKKDHIISEYETLPIYINAYKFADDNSDRSFTPLWHPVSPYEFSHEVYLSGMTKIIPVPHNDLLVSYTPDPLTAGVTPELVDPSNPLTFLVLDENGNSVNLASGIPDEFGKNTVPLRSMWNILIKDPHPDNKDIFGDDAKLPQYYWVRTDLQNNDGTLYDNESIYFSSTTPFDPIDVDFSSSKDGKYIFFNFCANDAGSFVVRMYTPDRRHYGETTVSVKLPAVNYKIVNDEDPEQRVFEVPGSPDFVLTALDKRIYTIEAQVFDAQGNIIKGAEEKVCEGYAGGRFTPSTTFLRNFRYPAIAQRRYYNLIGIDKNENGIIDPLNIERINLDGFEVIVGNTRYAEALYNTQNAIRSIDGSFYTGIALDIPPEYGTFAAWGLGCIYNSPYKGGYCFPDVDKDGDLTFSDSLPLDNEGKVKFKLYVNDFGLTESYLSGLVGVNRLSTSFPWADVAGVPGFSGDPFAPYDISRRFRYGGGRFFEDTMDTFRLDWDAFCDISVSIKGPDFRFLDAGTRFPIGKELLDPESYDICYGQTNHIIIQAIQADSRDLPVKDGGTVVVYGANHEMFVRGKFTKNVDGIPETLVTFTPTGTGQASGWINYIREKGGFGEFDDNIDVGLNQYAFFDAIPGLGIKVDALGDLIPKKKVSLRIKVFEVASEALITGADISITGVGASATGKTNKEGIFEVELLPTEEGELSIKAVKEGYLSGSKVIYIGKDNRPLFLYIDPTPGLTKEDSITFTGSTKTTASLTINGESVSLDSNGNFSVKFNLAEGESRFKFIATSDNEKEEEERLIIRDSVSPEIEVVDPGTLVDVKEMNLKGKVSEKDSSITVNGINASVIGLDWQVLIPLNYGKNILNIVAKDKAENEKIISKELYVHRKLLVEVQVGNKTVYLNGIPQQPLSTPPYIKNSKMMIPIKIISEVLGGEVEWNPAAKEVKIMIGDRIVSMVIGSTVAVVNGNPITLEVPPEIKEGTTFVPLRFISDVFGFEVEWIESTNTAKITRLI